MARTDKDVELARAVEVVTDNLPEDQPATQPDTQVEALPVHKPDLVALAIERGIASYEAWAMTVPELTKRLES